MKGLIIILITSTFLKIYGQKTDHIQNITPQPSEVNGILKLFETPISLYTGNPSISVPIYSIKEGDINFDIKLSYNSTGITVGERASWVGLGWNLSVPTLVRNVRQIPDDFSYGFFYEMKYNVINAYNLLSTIGPNVPLGQEGNVCPQCLEIDFLYKAGLLDLESDDYRVTLPDGNGISFMVNQERDAQHPIGHIVQFPDSDYKIDYITVTGSWEIINPQGYKYLYVRGNKITSQNTYTIGGTSIGVENLVKDQEYTSTWVLSKIISPSNHTLNFEYDTVVYEDCDLVNQTRTVAVDETLFPGDGRNLVFTNYSKTKGTNLFINRIWGEFGEVVFTKNGRIDYTTYGRKLDNIEIKNKSETVNKIAFEYNYMTSLPSVLKYTCNRFENDNDISRRLILKRVTLNSDTSQNISYQFNYNNQTLPNRFSYGRDWWGYYNGQDNNPGLTPGIDLEMIQEDDRNVKPTFTTAGILEEIIYPTGGKTRFLFENNRGIFKEYNNDQQQKIHDIIPFVRKQHFFSTNENTIPLLDKVYLHPLLIDAKELTTAEDQTIFITTTTNRCIYPENSIPLSNSCSIYYTLIDKNNEIVIPKSLLKENDNRSLSISKSKLINGLILKVELFSGKNLPYTQVFNHNQHEANITFIHKVIDTVMAKNTAYGIEVPFGGLRIKRIENYENALNPIIKEYDYKFDGVESGRSLFELDFLQTIPGKLFVTSQSKFPMQTGNGSIISYTHAKEFRVNPITDEQYNTSHVFDNRYLMGDYFPGCFFNIGGLGDGLKSSSVPCYEHPMNGKELSISYSNKKTEFFDYQSIVIPGKNLNRVYGLDFDRVRKPKDFSNVNLAGLGQTYLGAEFFYYNFKNFENPDYSKETRENFNGQELITKSEYKSLNTGHHQITNERVEFSDGEVIETTYAYAHEKNNQLLISKNMIGIPLETTTVQKQSAADPGKTVAKAELIYPASLPTAQAGSLVVPLSSKSMDKLNGILSTDVSYDKYDEKGNILQYTGRDGLVTSIVWGYNKTQPVAKIEGMTYDDLLSLASPAAIISASDEDAADPSKEAQLLEALNTFRKNNQLANKKVTTYTYDPLIGVTSITPPSGIRQSFSYDAANRLKETKVRGKNPAGSYTDKKAAEYRYNYKP